MNAASYFFRQCRQRQIHLQSSLTITQRSERRPILSHSRTFASFNRLYAQPVEAATPAEPAAEQPPASDKPTSLFCGGIPFGIERERVLQAFSKHGTVTSVRLPKHRENSDGWGGYNGGFCFVNFASHGEAAAALESMKGVDIGGKVVTLAYTTSSPPSADQARGKREKILGHSYWKKSLSERDQEYTRTQPLVIGTVSRARTMFKTVAVTTNRRQLDKSTQTHHMEEDSVLVHDPESTLVVGDVIKYQHFPPDVFAERSARGKVNVRYVLKEVVTPFGTPVEERTPYVPQVVAAPTKKSKLRKMASQEKIAAAAA